MRICLKRVVWRDEIPHPQQKLFRQFLSSAYSEAYDHLKRHGAKESGPCLAVWHQAADVYTNEEAEAAVPIDCRFPSTEQVQMYELPQQQVASVVHQGAFEDFTKRTRPYWPGWKPMAIIQLPVSGDLYQHRYQQHN